jgi:hypothetical protein
MSAKAVGKLQVIDQRTTKNSERSTVTYRTTARSGGGFVYFAESGSRSISVAAPQGPLVR